MTSISLRRRKAQTSEPAQVKSAAEAAQINGMPTPSKQATRSLPWSGRRDKQKQKTHKHARTAQGMIPYQAMLPNGIAWLGEDRWSLTAELGDISYLIAPQTAQEEILNRWARWLNSFGGGTSIQFTIVNEVLDADSFGRLARMKLTGDDGDVLREEFNRHIARKLATTRGNVLTRRYLTFTLTGEENTDTAQDRLLRALTETTNRLRQLAEHGGCTVRRLERPERLALLSALARRREPFAWTDDELAGGRARTKDAVAPWSVEDKGNHLIITAGARDTYHATVWVRRLPPWLSDRLVASLAEIRGDLIISLHLSPYDAADGLDLVHGQIANLEMQYLTEVKKASKQGYSTDLIPHTLLNARTEATELRRDLESSNQRIWGTITTVGLSADSKEELDGLVEQVTTALRSHSCAGEVVSSMMLDAFRAELPLGAKCLPMERTLTTSAVAVMHPFTTQELMEPRGLWYGANARSGNPVLAARTNAINGNGFVVGTSGGGKSHASKAEATSVLLTTDDDVIIIDLEREYISLCQRLGGQLVTVDAAGTTHINAMDVDLDSQADDPILSKSHFVLALMGALIGGNDGLIPTERSVIDRSTTSLLRAWAADPAQLRPTLVSLRDDLAQNGGMEGQHLARALDLYTDGSLGAFAQTTNVDLNNRLVCYDIAELSPELKTIGMMIVLEQIWNRVTTNRAKGRRTWLYVDEFHMLFRTPYTAEHFLTFFKRARKWGLMITGITQNIEELLLNQHARLMLANSDFLLLLNQSATDAESLRQLLRMSEEQRDCFTGVDPGVGLLKSGSAWIPFDNEMDRKSDLYKLFSTKFGEAK